MEYVNNKDIIIYFLKKDYKFLSNIITNLSKHINNLYDNYIIILNNNV